MGGEGRRATAVPLRPAGVRYSGAPKRPTERAETSRCHSRWLSSLSRRRRPTFILSGDGSRLSGSDRSAATLRVTRPLSWTAALEGVGTPARMRDSTAASLARGRGMTPALRSVRSCRGPVRRPFQDPWAQRRPPESPCPPARGSASIHLLRSGCPLNRRPPGPVGRT